MAEEGGEGGGYKLMKLVMRLRKKMLFGLVVGDLEK